MLTIVIVALPLNATSYGSIRVEHIWQDNNNAGNTRPDIITQQVIENNSKEDSFDISDDGSTLGAAIGSQLEEAGIASEDLINETVEAGKNAGIQTKNDIITDPNNLQVPNSTNEYFAEIEKYYKELNTNRPFGVDEGFLNGLLESFTGTEEEKEALKEQLRQAYSEGFSEGFGQDLPQDLDTSYQEERNERQELVDNITNSIEDLSLVEVTEIAESIQELIDTTVTGDLWIREEEVPISAEDGSTVNYDVIISDETIAELEAAGYETTKMRITITLVKEEVGDREIQRAYVSLDDGLTWSPANKDAEGTLYNPDKDYIEETTISFLHELKTELSPSSDISEDSNPDSNPKPKKEVVIEEEEPPLDEAPEIQEPIIIEESENEEPVVIDEEEIPLTEIPRTGDSSQLWVILSILSGNLLLILLLMDKQKKLKYNNDY